MYNGNMGTLRGGELVITKKTITANSMQQVMGLISAGRMVDKGQPFRAWHRLVLSGWGILESIKMVKDLGRSY